MDVWAGLHERLFKFRRIRSFDIKGKLTGLSSKALTSPGGKIRIPINEDAGDKGQIEEHLHACNGEGIQHIACGCKNVSRTVELLRGEGVVEGGCTKILSQLFSSNAAGPIFLEFIEREGDGGFGEGNFKALSESIEEDQIRRGVLDVPVAAP